VRPTQPLERPLREEAHRAKEEEYWRKSLRKQGCLNFITCIAAVAGLLSIGAIWGSLKATQTQAQTALDTLHSQRPNINFGLENGDMADYLPPVGNAKKGTIILHFRNTGPQSADSVLIDAFSTLPPAQKGEERHLLRYRTSITDLRQLSVVALSPSLLNRRMTSQSPRSGCLHHNNGQTSKAAMVHSELWATLSIAILGEYGGAKALARNIDQHLSTDLLLVTCNGKTGIATHEASGRHGNPLLSLESLAISVRDTDFTVTDH
jgi:hypothetical protein